MEGIFDVSRRLPNIPRFELDHDVLAAIGKMARTPTETLLKAFKFARPPNPTIWVEGAPSRENPEDRCGWLISETGSDDNRALSVIPVFSLMATGQGAPLANHHLATRFDSRGMGFSEDVGALVRRSSAPETLGAKTALTILLLLNSRSKILKIDETAPIANTIEKATSSKRSKSTRLPLDLTPIVLDVSRVLKKNSARQENEVRDVRYITLRDGHFKVRETGVFWWSPHNVKITEPLAINKVPTAADDAPFLLEDHSVKKRKTGDQHSPDNAVRFEL